MFYRGLIVVLLLFRAIHASRHHHGLHSHTHLKRSATHSSYINEGALKLSSDNVFVKISHDPPILVPSRADHPQVPVGVDNKNSPIQTNKFYANFFANNQDNATWTHPYSIWWPSDPVKQGYGLSISHTDRDDFIYGPGTPVKSFEDPAFRQSIALSARELQNGTVLTMDSLTAFSANVNLAPRRGASPLISFPVVQGMAFVTGVYRNSTVVIQSQKRFSNITDLHLSPADTSPSVYGWSVRLGDGSSWLIYLTATCLSGRPILRITDKGTILGPKSFDGIVQVAKNPAGAAGIDIFNKAAGVYPVGATISGTVSGRTGTYALAWKKKGIEQRKLLMFALPHHVASFSTETARGLTSITLASTTKGIATAVLADEFIMVERELPTDIGLDPWSPRLGSVGSKGSAATVSHDAKAAIIRAAKVELARDITKLTNLTSKYYGGIAFSVYARALYAVHNIAGDTSLTASSLAKLEAAFDRYVNNEEPNPLCYDDVWKGIVSSASYGNNDSSIDFGNTYYNDHNFHYGYYVYTAAIIAHFDPSWLSKNGGVNKIWVNNLIRDCWARGVLEAPDGKDQESSAEDAFSTYAIKMWGKVTGDASLEARGNLQLAVTARSLQSYFLLASDNRVQPANFIGNRATGILWDRKVNHTTYFGDNIAYIQGIHMLPIVPSSAYVRKPSFVRQEWDQYFAGNKSGSLSSGGFAGHIYANLAIADRAGAIESHAFFRNQTTDSPYLSGLSLTWDLAYTAAFGGCWASNVSVNSTRIWT
ncbi:related to glucan 1,3-beta-glucosidase [Fusarium fujikuroi IMI 58289]|uniref:glucan endo-1,3-beta-D-glucosidase n=1 Tax=Gibberella fujikuroi (strain CBS 195.34 / IMI 58289 / NRRL A-6831) TaxID=1279085 RepID=S0DRV6_GIBF5|nr:related to glucan 1,3-beta-glucosidase [Fusarium fujikuroi IMI 58289]KLP13787.1 glucan 1,3-beta-glucosidase [Fusarium fujikuroi]CCT63298.1 related to glucan 1,3-beta-glucosidase [Fusarium fujikuroi IMI 58289]SCN71122.1 related to glucan 1,3-beta-glucosidase [Fusarium fujikuroi]SCO30921.1 related to glucan 1,3-beta-glucosidase [Fusarium fujikuroi]